MGQGCRPLRPFKRPPAVSILQGMSRVVALSWVLLMLLLGCPCGVSGHLVHLCYLFFGPINDLGYTYSHNLARKDVHGRLQRQFPTENIVSDYAENAFFGNQSAIVEGFVARNCSIIIGTAPAFRDVIVSFARRCSQPPRTQSCP